MSAGDTAVMTEAARAKLRDEWVGRNFTQMGLNAVHIAQIIGLLSPFVGISPFSLEEVLYVGVGVILGALLGLFTSWLLYVAQLHLADTRRGMTLRVVADVINFLMLVAVVAAWVLVGTGYARLAVGVSLGGLIVGLGTKFLLLVIVPLLKGIPEGIGTAAGAAIYKSVTKRSRPLRHRRPGEPRP